MTPRFLRRLPAPALLLALSLTSACGGDGPTDPGAGKQTTVSALALADLNDALDLMQENSVNRYRIDWPALRDRAVQRAGTPRSTADTYPAIIAALRELGDRHSFFIRPGPSASRAAAVGEPPTGQTLGRLAYVWMPGFSGSGAVDHASAYHSLLRALDAGGPCGWIVDLRGNTGWNMWPMLAGIGPVLGEGEPGAFLDPDGARQPWYYEGGTSGYDNGANRSRIVTVNGAPYVLRRPAPPVAVLTGGRTASSGEAIVVAFRGRPETRSFGLPTYGVPTANRGYVLSDGATMLLTVAWDVDRDGVVYDAPIFPDERVDGEIGDPAHDPVVGAASAWLLARPACAN